MRFFATSDLHVDYLLNAQWVEGLSTFDYQDDVLIVAGDVTDSLTLLQDTLTTLARCFRRVFFVPGNHELWVIRDATSKTSLQKLAEVRRSSSRVESAWAPQCWRTLPSFHC